MNSVLERHFILLDNAKRKLLNSKNEKEEQYRKLMLRFLENQEKYFYINKKALVTDNQPNN